MPVKDLHNGKDFHPGTIAKLDIFENYLGVALLHSRNYLRYSDLVSLFNLKNYLTILIFLRLSCVLEAVVTGTMPFSYKS